MKQKCVFLDRDGILNEDNPDYTYRPEQMLLCAGVSEGLQKLKEAGYLLIVVTNQAGIAKGLYSRTDVWNCHRFIEQASGVRLDDLYFCPHHPDYTSNTLARKPGSLMLEKAIAKYDIDTQKSWMVGDRPRDITAGQRVGVRTIHVTPHVTENEGDFHALNFEEVTKLVLDNAYF
jgi:D-glycero-D-manno-heptose 1,7-bisphosphate phosphatase